MAKTPRRRLKIALVIGVLCLSIAAALVWWLAVPRYVERRADEAIAQIARFLEVEVVYESLTVDGLSRLVLNDVTVRPRDALKGEPPMATFERVVLDLTGTSLLRQKIRISGIDVTKPRVRLARRSDGTDNFGELRRRIESLVRRGGLRPTAGPRTSRIWKYLDKHVPKITMSAGELVVADASMGRGLIPRPLPSELTFSNWKGTMHNESVLSDQLRLAANSTFDVPQLGSEAELSGHFDRRTDALELFLRIPTRSSVRLAGYGVSVERASWRVGGALHFEGVRVDDRFDAREVVLWPRTEPPAEGALIGATGVVGIAIRRLKRVELTEPRLRLVSSDGATEWLEGLASPPVGANIPAAEGTRSPPKRIRRPKLKKKKGAKVREWLTRTFASTHSSVRATTRKLHALSRRFPLPELSVNLGTLELTGAKPGTDAVDTTRFDLSVRRTDHGFLEATIRVPGPDKATPLAEVTGRVQLQTGDLQVDVRATRLPLLPYASMLGGAVRAGASTVLEDTNLRVVYSQEAEALHATGKLGVGGLILDLPWAASKPMEKVGFKATLGTARADFAAATLDTQIQWTVGTVAMSTVLKASELRGEPMLEWKIDVPMVAAQAVADALPDAFLGQLRGLKLSGALAWSNSGSLDTRDMRSLDYDSRLQTRRVRVEDLGDRVDFDTLAKPFVHRVQEPDGSVIEFTTGPGSSRFVSLSRISPFLAKVLTTTEDGTFFRHRGLAFFAIKDAIIDNLEKGRFYRGASTLTQQLVKNVFLIREKTLSRKAQELLLAWQIEKVLSKNRILELYLNVVELGPDIYGLRRAARHYFGKSAAELDLAQCLWLGSILPSPRRYYRHYRRGKVSEGWRKGLERIAHVMLKRKKITRAQLEAAAPFSPEFRTSK